MLLGILYKAGHPLSVPQIIRLLKARGIKVNKTTVYRQVTLLLNSGAVREIWIEPNITHYELSGLEHHHHLVCESCGKVDKVASRQLEKSMERLEVRVAKSGFEIKKHSLEFYGICSSCQ